jgi:RNA polymerase sigma factor (sigma-70 family)
VNTTPDHPGFIVFEASMTVTADSVAVANDPIPNAEDNGGQFERLLQRMREGSQEAALQIVKTYGPHIRSAVKRRMCGALRSAFDSEDFVQSAWKSLLRMPPAKMDEIREPGQLVGMLAAIAARKAIDEYRHCTRETCHETRRRELDDPEVLAALAKIAGVNTPSQICIAREKQHHYRQRWEELVSRQPPHHQRIVYLRLGGQPYAAIAEAEDVSERQARRVVERLFKRLSDSERAA